MTSELRCMIWPQCPAGGRFVEDAGSTRFENSPRAAGGYILQFPVEVALETLEPAQRARLTTWLIEQRSQGDLNPRITPGNLKSAVSRPALPAHQRADRLLRYFADSITTVGDHVAFGGPEDYKAYAVSESTLPHELNYLISYLQGMGWINGTHTLGGYNGTVTVAGFARVGTITQNVDSTQAFVAMWFDKSMDDAFVTGFQPAIADTGFAAMRIDQKDHINKIDDEIIAELRRSRFVVADFTHGNDGARGGVYYEAGFAHGLNLPVIFTCHANAVSTLHFDINHYNHIVWTTPHDLRTQLMTRILAVIGEGPAIQQRS